MHGLSWGYRGIYLMVHPILIQSTFWFNFFALPILLLCKMHKTVEPLSIFLCTNYQDDLIPLCPYKQVALYAWLVSEAVPWAKGGGTGTGRPPATPPCSPLHCTAHSLVKERSKQVLCASSFTHFATCLPAACTEDSAYRFLGNFQQKLNW